MEKRGYKPDPIWRNTFWRGNTLGFDEFWALGGTVQSLLLTSNTQGTPIYPEHNDDYLQECLDNLKSKNIIIEI